MPDAQQSAFIKNTTLDLKASNAMLPKDLSERLGSHPLKDRSQRSLLLVWQGHG
jgi:hypothetical protein